MLRVSKLTDYAVVVLSRLEAEGGVQTAPGLASATGLGEPTVAKVLKMLSQAGLVEGQRGARGGYRLLRPLAQLPLSEVIVAQPSCTPLRTNSPAATDFGWLIRMLKSGSE